MYHRLFTTSRRHPELSKFNHWPRLFQMVELNNMFGILSSHGWKAQMQLPSALVMLVNPQFYFTIWLIYVSTSYNWTMDRFFKCPIRQCFVTWIWLKIVGSATIFFTAEKKKEMIITMVITSNNFLKLPKYFTWHTDNSTPFGWFILLEVCLPKIWHMACMLLKIRTVKFSYLNIRSLLDKWRNKKAFLVCGYLLAKTIQFFNETKNKPLKEEPSATDVVSGEVERVRQEESAVRVGWAEMSGWGLAILESLTGNIKFFQTFIFLYDLLLCKAHK